MSDFMDNVIFRQRVGNIERLMRELLQEFGVNAGAGGVVFDQYATEFRRLLNTRSDYMLQPTLSNLYLQTEQMGSPPYQGDRTLENLGIAIASIPQNL